MLSLGPAKKVTIHLNEDSTAAHDFLYKEIVLFLLDQGVSGATLMRPAAGFGSHHRLHQESESGAGGEHLPVRIEFIETKDKVDDLLPSLELLVTDGLIEVQDTTILKIASRLERS
jgi:PII-like signaling protein